MLKQRSTNVAQAIDVGIDRQLDRPVALGWDDNDAAALLQFYGNEVSVTAFVGQQRLECWPFSIDERQLAFVIEDFAFGQGKSYVQARRLDTEIDLDLKRSA